MLKPDPQKVAEYGQRLDNEEDEGSREIIRQEFLDYARDFVSQFSRHYHDFAPRPDGNVACTMEGYIKPRQRVAYVINSRTGFVSPVDKDTERGSKYQDIGRS